VNYGLILIPVKTLTQIKKRVFERRVRLQRARDLIVNQLKELGALRIFQFGSTINGEISLASDLDLIVIMPPTKTGWEWMNLIYESVDRTIGADIIVYTPDEFEKMLKESSFVRHAIKTGRKIYEKE
jgi:predicted nucleotidyltransferase